MDILIKNSKLREKQYNVNIGISQGKIRSIIPSNSESNADIEQKADTIIDARGRLATPALIEPHLHIDMCQSGNKPDPRHNIPKTVHDKSDEDLYNRICRMIGDALQNGVTSIRAHVEINPGIGLKNLETAIEAKKKFADFFKLQVCPFPAHGFFRDKALGRLMKKAVRKGIDAIGGCPSSEITWEDSKNHIDFCFKLGKYYGKPLDIHIAETGDPYSKELEYLASKKIKDSYPGPVTASHTCSLSSLDGYKARRMISLLKEAGIGIILMPGVSLMRNGCGIRKRTPVPPL